MLEETWILKLGVLSAEMGICISTVSSEIQDSGDGHENMVFFEDSTASIGIQRLGSLHSQPGSKGLNQDAAILHQVSWYVPSFLSSFGKWWSKLVLLWILLI